MKIVGETVLASLPKIAEYVIKMGRKEHQTEKTDTGIRRRRCLHHPRYSFR